MQWFRSMFAGKRKTMWMSVLALVMGTAAVRMRNRRNQKNNRLMQMLKPLTNR